MEVKDIFGKYDVVFSVGSVCGCSEAIRGMGLQYTSYPLDWAGGGGLLAKSAGIVASRFTDWFNKEDFRLTGYSRTTHSNLHYQNIRNGQNFWHDFPCGCSFDEQFPKVAAKYRRRVERFLADMASAKRVLAVYCATPKTKVPTTDEDIVSSQAAMASAYPHLEFNLLVFRQDFSAKAPRETMLNEHCLVIDLDYHQLDEYGEISHIFKADEVCSYLGRHFKVDDPRTEEEKAAYRRIAAERKKPDRWGKSGWDRWVNRKLFKLWRHLDRMLIRRGVIPPEVWK